jgi:predicted alpha/beta-fold hydrolase
MERLPEIRTVRQFDAAFTAPHFGFASAEDYYHRASAMRVVSRIRVPALILSAADDPFVPAELFRAPAVTSNPNIRAIVTPHGGHCGFLEHESKEHDGYWAERRIVEFAAEVCRLGPLTEGGGVTTPNVQRSNSQGEPFA